jgi:hypothetical protein
MHFQLSADRPPLSHAPQAVLASYREAAEDARQESTARGGDADLIGHAFENERSGLAVGFLDEQRAVVGLNGKEDMAPYKVRGSHVLVYGKGMPLQLNRSGTGVNTTLEWLGKVLKRHERFRCNRFWMMTPACYRDCLFSR